MVLSFHMHTLSIVWVNARHISLYKLWWDEKTGLQIPLGCNYHLYWCNSGHIRDKSKMCFIQQREVTWALIKAKAQKTSWELSPRSLDFGMLQYSSYDAFWYCDCGQLWSVNAPRREPYQLFFFRITRRTTALQWHAKSQWALSVHSRWKVLRDKLLRRTH